MLALIIDLLLTRLIPIGIGYLLVKAFMYRIEKGRFCAISGDPKRACPGFRSDCGTFLFDRNQGILAIEHEKGIQQRIPFDSITRIHLCGDDERTFKSEIAIERMLGAADDLIERRFVSIELEDHTMIPLFAASQYKRRDVFLNSVIELEKAILSKIGLFRNVDALAQSAYIEIVGMFRIAGKRDWQNPIVKYQ